MDLSPKAASPRPSGLPKAARPLWTLVPRRVAGVQGVKLPCSPALRVSASICIKGKGFARHPRPVAGKPALRPPVSPLTPIPAEIAYILSARDGRELIGCQCRLRKYVTEVLLLHARMIILQCLFWKIKKNKSFKYNTIRNDFNDSLMLRRIV